MALLTSRKTQPRYDVIVVGSGAAGGQTAYTLAMEGAKVLMLEAGRNYDPTTETPMFQINGEAPLRGAGTPDKAFGFHDATIDGGWSVPGEPYTNASTDPKRQFAWWRARMEENLLRQSGRGILLIQAFVDELEVRKGAPSGTVVRMVKYNAGRQE